MSNEPLFLPKGSVQAILALTTTTFIFTALFFKIALPEYVVVTWAGMIGLYFGNRGNTNQEKKNE